MSTADLPRLMSIVDNKLKALPVVNADMASREAFWRAADKALVELERDHGARVKRNSDAKTLALGGGRASCTHGSSGLMQNWRNAAERKLGRPA